MSVLLRLIIGMISATSLIGCSNFITSERHSHLKEQATHLASNVSYQSVTEQLYQLADHRISYGTDPAQFGLLWSSITDQGDRPLVIFIHGGCWLSEYNP